MNTFRKTWLPLIVVAALAWGAAWGLRSWQAADQASRLQAAVKPGDIVMLSSTTCYFCAKARSWLNAHAVPHRECFIETDAACLAQFQALQAQGTPTFVVRGRRVVGFDREAILAALEP
ncbi:glutaredoxin family protein [Roseateles toxinivorans]|uniref:Glutaredoxin n=1 Tax=Roseateles toxinivorans TaxID=270368 RepID=A0A4R6QJX1_9BURK|nr:glutaredoxin family protein [Roseateles toxinivorans]TDP63193.1 glutaredoxin [Roseateles toxinivorans]